jgi:ribosomal protein L35
MVNGTFIFWHKVSRHVLAVMQTARQNEIIVVTLQPNKTKSATTKRFTETNKAQHIKLSRLLLQILPIP